MPSLATKPLHCPECSAVVIEASKLTFKQDAVVRAALKPTNGTITAVAADVGIPRNSASRMLHSATVRTELAKRRAKRLDNARAIGKIAAEVVASEVRTRNDPEYALRAWPIAAAIVEKGLDGDESESPEEHIERLKRLVREIVLSSLTCGLDRPGKAVAILERHGRRCVRDVQSGDYDEG